MKRAVARRDHAEDVQREESLARTKQRALAAERIEAGERPWEEQQGVLAAVEAVRDLHFPITRGEIAACAGDRRVHVSERLELSLAEVVGKLKEEVFTSPGEFETALLRHWEGVRAAEPGEGRG